MTILEAMSRIDRSTDADERLPEKIYEVLMLAVDNIITEVRDAERERCAKIADEYAAANAPDQLAFDIARRIREGK